MALFQLKADLNEENELQVDDPSDPVNSLQPVNPKDSLNFDDGFDQDDSIVNEVPVELDNPTIVEESDAQADPDQFNPANPIDPPNPDDLVSPDPEENPVDTMVTKEPMSEIISNEEVYLAQEQDEQVKKSVISSVTNLTIFQCIKC